MFHFYCVPSVCVCWSLSCLSAIQGNPMMGRTVEMDSLFPFGKHPQPSASSSSSASTTTSSSSFHRGGWHRISRRSQTTVAKQDAHAGKKTGPITVPVSDFFTRLTNNMMYRVRLSKWIASFGTVFPFVPRQKTPPPEQRYPEWHLSDELSVKL